MIFSLLLQLTFLAFYDVIRKAFVVVIFHMQSKNTIYQKKSFPSKESDTKI